MNDGDYPDTPGDGRGISRDRISGEGVSSGPGGKYPAPLPWPGDPQDPEGAAIGEAWSSLDQWIRGADLTSFDAAAQARLVGAVRRRGRRRRVVWGTVVAWGSAMAVAAAALIMLSIRRDGPLDLTGHRPHIAGQNPDPAPAPNPRQDRESPPGLGPTPSAEPRSSSVAEVRSIQANPRKATGTATTRVDAAASPRTAAVTTPSAAEFWGDRYDADLESARLQAREVELSWQRGPEPLTGLRQRFDAFEADWNDRSL